MTSNTATAVSPPRRISRLLHTRKNIIWYRYCTDVAIPAFSVESAGAAQRLPGSAKRRVCFLLKNPGR